MYNLGIYYLYRPTFYQIYQRKSTEGFQSIPYLVSLISAMLLMYYGFLKNDILLITINAFGCFIETAYIVAYLVYAPTNARVCRNIYIYEYD